jgi:hypothetical protein
MLLYQKLNANALFITKYQKIFLKKLDIFLSDNTYYISGMQVYQKSKKNVHSNLEQIIKKNIINGDVLQNMWFPTEIFGNNNFVFISHSHKDEKLAIRLAGYLYEKFSIISFIDSCVWGYMDELNIASTIQKISKIESPIMEGVSCLMRKIEFTPNLNTSS